MSETSKPVHLKDRVRLRTKPFLVVGALFLLWVNLGLPTSFVGVVGLEVPASMVKGLPSLLSLLAMAVDALPGSQVKAALVFLKRKHPLPGSRAFERVNLDRDSRVNKKRLRDMLGGSFPRAPVEQNRAWYELYRSVEGDGRILGLHSEYLVLRDLTWFSVMLTCAALVSLAIAPSNWRGIVGVAATFAVFYLLFRKAASERGYRLVNTVLALVSSDKKSRA